MIRKLLYVNVAFGSGLHQFLLLFFLFLLKFQNNWSSVYTIQKHFSERYWHSTLPPPSLTHSNMYVCVCVLVCVSPQMCMWWVGYMYMPPRHLVAPTGSANATVWVTLRQFAPHHLIFVPKCYFFTGSVSAYGLPPSCCCFHHYCWGFFLIFFPPRSVPLVLLDRLKLL